MAVLIVVYGNRDMTTRCLNLKTIFESKGFMPIAAAAFLGEHSYTDKLAGGRLIVKILKKQRSSTGYKK